MQISGYKLLRTIGQGGMATVYEAIQTSLNRRVAIKILSPSLVADPEFCVRFLKEGKILAQLSHPNIITIYDIGQTDGVYFMSMEYLESDNLRSRIEEGMTEQEAIDIVLEVAGALGYAHDRGFLHRDVKPLNVLFREDGTSVLTDFGIAKSLADNHELTRAGKTIGSPLYMSPEQIRDEPLDIRSDLYSLGIVMYQMLTGYAPYLATTADATTRMHLSCPLPSLPEHLDHYQPVIRRLLAKSRNNRYQNAWELIEALQEIRQRRHQPMRAVEKTVQLSVVDDRPGARIEAESDPVPTVEVQQPPVYRDEKPPEQTVPLEQTMPLHSQEDEKVVPLRATEKTQELDAIPTAEPESRERKRFSWAAGFAGIAALLAVVLLPGLLNQTSEVEPGKHAGEQETVVETEPQPQVVPAVEPKIESEVAEAVVAEEEKPGLLIALQDPVVEEEVETEVAVAEENAAAIATDEAQDAATSNSSDAQEQTLQTEVAESETEPEKVAEVEVTDPAKDAAEAETEKEESQLSELPSLEQRAESAELPSLEERAAAEKPAEVKPERTAGGSDTEQENAAAQEQLIATATEDPGKVQPLEQVASLKPAELKGIEEQPAALVKKPEEASLAASARDRFRSLKDPGIMLEGNEFLINYELEGALRQVSNQVFRGDNGSVSLSIALDEMFQPETDQLEQGGLNKLDRLAYIFRNYSGFGIDISAERKPQLDDAVLDVARLRAERVHQYLLSNLIDPGRISSSIRYSRSSAAAERLHFYLAPNI